MTTELKQYFDIVAVGGGYRVGSCVAFGVEL